MDEKATFEKRYKENKSFITSVLHRYVKNERTVEDLVQQTFIKAWIGRKGFEGRSNYKTWLYRIAVNVTFTYLLRQKHQVKILSDDLSNFESSITSLHYVYGAPLKIVAAEDDLRVLKAEIEHLPKNMQQALIMHTVYGLPYEEIAESLKIPIGTVRSRINRARTALMQRVGHLLDE